MAIESEEERQTVIPDNFDHTNATIETKENKVIIKFEKKQKIIDIIKLKGYRWDKTVWYKTINEYTGEISDRIADVGNALLLSGSAVRFNIDNYEEIKTKAINADFIPEEKRWVKYIDDKLVLSFERNDKLYEEAMKIIGARWSKDQSGVVVPKNSYNEVDDFAGAYGFKFSDSAKKAIDYMSDFVEASKVTITKKEEKQAEKMLERFDTQKLLEELNDD